MSDAPLSPAQQEVVDQIGAKRETWPEFPAELRVQLKEFIRDGIAEQAERLGDRKIWANKHAVASVHGCEKRYLADREFPGWSVPLARGTVVHKAIEFSINWQGTPVPADLVDESRPALSSASRTSRSFSRT